MSSARIPLLSLALPFFEFIDGSLYFHLCEILYFISRVFVVAFLLCVHSCFQVLMVMYFSLIQEDFGIKFAVQFNEDICNTFS